MTDSVAPGESGYRPDYTIRTPPFYAWPPRLPEAARYLFVTMLYPWGYFFIGLAVVTWYFLTPSMATMAILDPGWMALVWLRNAGLLILVAGTLHWWLYIRRSQGTRYKFDRRWLATDDDKFLWNNQVRDNMFWSLVPGVTIWSLYECITLWVYASGRQPIPWISEHPVYFVVTVFAVFFWSTAHFYFVHRFLHWKPVYDVAHELHHRNVNIGPWTGISMHPLEHALYFSVFMLWWVVPVHPVIIVLCGFFQGISPSVSHSGFDFFRSGNSRGATVGDYFHTLHHKYFHVNYGNTPTPFDKVFDSWHDGTDAGREVVRRRMRKQAG